MNYNTTRLIAAAILACAAIPQTSSASIAYGSLNNFDVINDTGTPCHGFEIEIEGARSRDITYTYDWNHYGAPRIQEDLSNPLLPKVIIRYASGKNADGSWTAYTAVPAGPLAPTDGHSCTNPGVNQGCEHFGAGYYGAPSSVRYFWLVDDGAGNLIRGPIVNIGTPTFAYVPPVANVAPAQVQAAIEPPEPAEIPLKEFGEPTWVKEIRTTSHNNKKVRLEDLVSDDPDDDNEVNWRNGEPDEIEVEWQLLQTEFGKDDGGANGNLVAAPEPLENGDEVVTRRYEFFKYIGPIDPETGEALADEVGPDDVHGVGTKTVDGVEYDLENTPVVGDYIGAQMAGFDAAPPLGLIDHLQPGDQNEPYVERTLVAGGVLPLLAYVSAGALPDGMDFDGVTGILSGTPTVSGIFNFTIFAGDAGGAEVSKAFELLIAPGAPTLDNLRATDVSPSSATLRWLTDQPTSSQIEINGVVQITDNALTADHAVPLAGLTPGTPYEIVVIATNGDGKSTRSDAILFTTSYYPTDLNRDGCIDRSDLRLITAAIQAKSTDSRFDLNGDGKVNIADARKLTLAFSNPNGAPCP